jgi:hypothetical protein
LNSTKLSPYFESVSERTLLCFPKYTYRGVVSKKIEFWGRIYPCLEGETYASFKASTLRMPLCEFATCIVR